MIKYPKRKSVTLYTIETRKQEGEELTIKVIYKYRKSTVECPEKAFDPEHEGVELKAYVRQLSAHEVLAARAQQDGSALEVVINARPIERDMYMEFEAGHYQIGPADRFEFETPEIKFRATAVTPVTADVVEYRRYGA